MIKVELCYVCKRQLSEPCEECRDFSNFHPLGAEFGVEDFPKSEGERWAFFLYLLQLKQNGDD